MKSIVYNVIVHGKKNIHQIIKTKQHPVDVAKIYSALFCRYPVSVIYIEPQIQLEVKTKEGRCFFQ